MSPPAPTCKLTEQPASTRRLSYLLLCCFAALLLRPALALAHGGDSHSWGDTPLLLRWTWHTGIILILAAISALYIVGLRNLWRSAGIGRGIQRRHAFAFALSILALIAALLSPIDVLSDDLSWMHMTQHMMLMMVAAPLFVLGAPATISIWAFPARTRRRLAPALHTLDTLKVRGYLLWHPLLLWTLFAFTLWVWHLPALYEAALHNETLHDFQHIGFFAVSCLFWRILLDPLSRLRLNPALGILYLFTSSLQATVLGIFMAIAPDVWYPWYEGRTGNLTALEDQQLAGFIMWMPACLIYALAAAIIFGLWLRDHDPEAQLPNNKAPRTIQPG